MARLARLLAGLAALAALAGCGAIVLGNPSGPTCDRNGDQEQRSACLTQR